MIKRTVIILFLAYCRLVSSQTNFCECCSYHSLQYRFTEYETIFPPDLILKSNVKQLLVFASGRLKDDTSQTAKIKIRKTLLKEYPEIKFQFDNRGYVSKTTLYAEMGKPHFIYQFERNDLGKVIKVIFSYIDSLENIYPNLAPEITVYNYDGKANLIKEKKLGPNGEDLPDGQSNYISYAYDVKNRLIKKVDYIYFDEKSIYTHTTTIKYNDADFTAESSITNDGKEWITEKLSYDSTWKVTAQKSFMADTKKVNSSSKSRYNSFGQLISYTTTQKGFECPETNGFSDLYFYDDNKLIKTITHTFGKYTCEMTFEYK